MDENDDLDTCNGDTVHDMWIDFDQYKTSATPLFSRKKTSTNVSTT